jgi:Domain of unknown function (DUF4292)
LRKINFILFLLILSTGCSVIRNGRNRNYGLSDAIVSEKLFESIRKQNITSNSFFIQKAEFLISSKEGAEKLLGSIKFESPDKYLISIKSRTGIEAARIFISDDTILINDRINRKQYYGSTQYLKSKYGITTSVLPIIFGDYITDNLSDNKAICSDGKLDIIGTVGGIKIKYVIDCKKGKIILAIPENRSNEEGIEIQYSDFFKNENVLSPGKIEIKDFQRETTVDIKIQKIESQWSGKIEFVPGKGYELIRLL